MIKKIISILYFFIYYNPQLSFKKWYQYNKGRQSGFQTLLCYGPFRNLFFGLNGGIYVCCRSGIQIGSYPSDEINDIWNGEKMKIIRSRFKKNIFPEECAECKSLFESGNYGIMFSKTLDSYNFRSRFRYPSSLDFWLKNTCNLECIMCNDTVSSSIRKHKKLEPLTSVYDEKFSRSVAEFSPYLKNVNFCGGEPFLIDMYFDLWEKIIEKNPAAQINIITNGTVLNTKVKNILEKGYFNVLISIDSLNKEKFERIRKNASFDIVMRSLSYYEEYAKRKKTTLGISYTPQIENWQDIKEILELCNKMNVTINISPVIYPQHFSLKGINKNKLLGIYEYYNSLNFESVTETQKRNLSYFNDFKDSIKYWMNDNTPEDIHDDLKDSAAYIKNISIDEIARDLIGKFDKELSSDLSLTQKVTVKITDIEFILKSIINKSGKQDRAKKILLKINEMPAEKVIAEIESHDFETIINKAVELVKET